MTGVPLSPGSQHQIAPVVPARNTTSPFHPGNIPPSQIPGNITPLQIPVNIPSPTIPDIPTISLSPFTSKLPSSLQSQLDIDFGFESHRDQIKYEYDSTGIFHWCPPRDIEQCLVSRQEIAR